MYKDIQTANENLKDPIFLKNESILSFFKNK